MRKAHRRSPSSPTPSSSQSRASKVRVKLWVKDRKRQTKEAKAIAAEAAAVESTTTPARPKVNVLIASQKQPSPYWEEEQLPKEANDSGDDAGGVRLLVAPDQKPRQRKFFFDLLMSVVWLSLSGGVLVGTWIALQLVINPGSVGWLSWLFPEWGREAELHARDAPKPLDELAAIAQETGLQFGTPINLHPHGQPANRSTLMIPVTASPQGCSGRGCGRIVELRVYHAVEDSWREQHYQLGDRIAIEGPDEFFVTAPLVQVTSLGPGSSRALPLHKVERFTVQPSEHGIWFAVSGEHRIGRDRLRFGQIGWYDFRRQRLGLDEPWTSPNGSRPRWTSITGNETPELVIDQTVGLEPRYLVYFLRPPANGRSLNLEAISLQQVPLANRSYENALLLAQHGLWSPALEVLESLKQQYSDDWPAYAQAQLDLVALHAKVTQRNAERDWANAGQDLIAMLIDGQWENSWAFLMAELPRENSVSQVLQEDQRSLWRRVEAAVRVSPNRTAVSNWASLMQYLRGGREAAIVQLQGADSVTPVSLTRQQRNILQQLDNALLSRTTSTTPTANFYGTATPVTTPAATDWQQADGTAPTVEPSAQWYRIRVEAVQGGETWERSPFPTLLGAGATPRYLWRQLGFDRHTEIILSSWNAAGQRQTRQTTVQGLRWENGSLELLVMAEGMTAPPPTNDIREVESSENEPETPTVVSPIAHSRSALQWQFPDRISLNAAVNDDPALAETLAQTLSDNLQETGALTLDWQNWGTAPLYGLGNWTVQQIELTGDDRPELIIPLSQDLPFVSSVSPQGNLIISSQGRIIYSEIGAQAGQPILAIATMSNSDRPMLITQHNGRYRLHRWSDPSQRFE